MKSKVYPVDVECNTWCVQLYLFRVTYGREGEFAIKKLIKWEVDGAYPGAILGEEITLQPRM